MQKKMSMHEKTHIISEEKKHYLEFYQFSSFTLSSQKRQFKIIYF